MYKPNDKSNFISCKLYGIYCYEKWCPFCEETVNNLNESNFVSCELYGIKYYKYQCSGQTIYLKIPNQKPKKKDGKK